MAASSSEMIVLSCFYSLTGRGHKRQAQTSSLKLPSANCRVDAKTLVFLRVSATKEREVVLSTRSA